MLPDLEDEYVDMVGDPERNVRGGGGGGGGGHSGDAGKRRHEGEGQGRGRSQQGGSERDAGCNGQRGVERGERRAHSEVATHDYARHHASLSKGEVQRAETELKRKRLHLKNLRTQTQQARAAGTSIAATELNYFFYTPNFFPPPFILPRLASLLRLDSPRTT